MDGYTLSVINDNKYRLFISIAVIALLFLSQESHGAQYANSEVLRIDNTTGLSSQKVYSFAEDENGAIWISTKSGVDRFNGRVLKNYSLENNSSYGDRAGRIIRPSFSSTYRSVCF